MQALDSYRVMTRLFSTEPCMDQEKECTIIMLFHIVIAQQVRHEELCDQGQGH